MRPQAGSSEVVAKEEETARLLPRSVSPVPLPSQVALWLPADAGVAEMLRRGAVPDLLVLGPLEEAVHHA